MKKIMISLSAVLILIVLFLSSQWDPTIPKVSKAGGFYSKNFKVFFDDKIGSSIYYTTDGSIPNINSKKYDSEEGILIYDKSSETNVYNLVKKVVCDYNSFNVNQNAVQKAFVLQAVRISNLGYCSDVFTDSYFVGTQAEENLMYANVIFEPDDLFGSDGISVTGEQYDFWYERGKAGEAPEPNFLKKIEKNAKLQLYYNEQLILSQNIGIRIQGSSNRYAKKKRFILTSRDGSIEKDCFNYALFKDEEGKAIWTHSVMLKESIADAIVGEILLDRNVATQGAIPVRVFLNGEFWYDTYILERYDKKYFKEHYGVDDVVIIKNSEALDYGDGQQDLYDEFVKFIDDADFSDDCGYSDEYWSQLNQMMDIDSFIEYMVTNYYFCNVDVSDTKNTMLWRSKNIVDDGYSDGRWRWCIYDIDAINFGEISGLDNPAEVNTFTMEMPFIEGATLSSLFLFDKLKENGHFRERFVTIFNDMVNSDFSLKTVEPILEKYGADISWMKGFFERRAQYAREHICGLW